MARLDVKTQDPERYAQVKAEQEELKLQFSMAAFGTSVARLCPYCEHMVFACTALLAASLSACGSKPAENTDTGTASSAAASSSSSEQQQENTLTGSLDEKKNGMFVVTDAEGAAYEFTYDPSDTPKGLDDAAEGDSVTVTYTGTVSEVDSFDGTVVSVEKAAAAQN